MENRDCSNQHFKDTTRKLLSLNILSISVTVLFLLFCFLTHFQYLLKKDPKSSIPYRFLGATHPMCLGKNVKKPVKIISLPQELSMHRVPKTVLWEITASIWRNTMVWNQKNRKVKRQNGFCFLHNDFMCISSGVSRLKLENSTHIHVKLIYIPVSVEVIKRHYVWISKRITV